MSRAGTIVAAVDFSADARHAALRAARLAAQAGARLVLLHVVSERPAESLEALMRALGRSHARQAHAARDSLLALAEEVRAMTGVAAEARVEEGEVTARVAAAAAHARLLVLGARGWNRLRDMLLGSTAERLLGRSHCPCLVVRRAPRHDYRRVIVGIDFSAHSAAALRAAQRWAPAAETTLLHACDIPFAGRLALAGVDEAQVRAWRTDARRHALAQLIDLAGDTHRGGGAPLHVVGMGHPSGVILARARSARADLIVIGKHGRSAALEMFLGSVTRHVLADAAADVLVVHAAARAR